MRVFLVLFFSPALAVAQPTITGYADAEVHGALFINAPGSPIVGINTGWALRGGAIFNEHWGAFAQVEQSLWAGTEYGGRLVPGSLSVAAGAEYRFAQGLMRTAAAFGPAILLFDTQLDKAGSIGVFFDLRPLGLRWKVAKHFVIGFDPLSFAISAPVLSGIPLVRVQYRTTLVFEGLFP